MIKLSIIIVNYNTTEHLIECLNTIESFCKEFNYEVITVDNNSTDRKIEQLVRKYTTVKFYFRDINDGFGNGCNYGASKSSGEYLAFVNPDTIFKDNVFSDVIEFMNNNISAGMCSTSFYNFEENIRHTISEFPDLYTEFLEAKGRGTNKRLNKYLESDEIKNGRHFEVDWITGACMIFRAKCFNEINGFDPDYFLYYEDVDIQFRVKKAGYKIFCLSNLKIYHSSNSSIKSIEGENIYFYNMHRSKMIYFYKNTGLVKRNIVRFMQIIGLLIRISLLYFRKTFKDKRNQKMFQYKKMLSVYFMGKNKLFGTTGLVK